MEIDTLAPPPPRSGGALATPGGDALPAIHRGHRALLETLRDFAGELDARDGSLESARGAVAFLRQGLLPFARREELDLLAAVGSADGAALDHAFLAAEIDVLAAETRALAAAEPWDAAGALDAVRRRVHRLEAVLELHLARDDEREEDGFAPAGAAAAPARGEGAGPREMTGGELGAFLAGRSWGVLSTVGPDGVPYAVPVSYAWDGDSFLMAMGPGRKLRHVQARGAVCLTVPDVADGDRWRCAVASGAAAPVTGVLERARALRLIARQRGAGRPAPADVARAARSRVFRLRPAELTGRARG